MALTPIFIHHKRDDDKIKCPKCGHEFELKDDEDLWGFILPLAGIVILLVLMIVFMDFGFSGKTRSEYLIEQKESFLELFQRLRH